jgi:phosphatidate cytidylyltransferase
LRTRIISALVLAPIALLAAYFGYPFWDLLVACLGALMGWEWANLCGGAGRPPVRLALVAGILGAIAVLEWSGVGGSLVVVALAGVAVAAFAWLRREPQAHWHGIGTAYLGLACLALIWIRNAPAGGIAALFWVLLLVWTVDTAAYFVGRAVGGPKLAPRISPNKTWSGLAGGVAGATLVGLVFALAVPVATPWIFVAISAALALAEQAGDLFESAVKRRFGVKDSGSIIPGHGGILDRVDGLIAVAIVVAALTLLSGQNPMAW